MNHQRLIGASVERVDARDKVAGKTRYVADIAVPNLHHGKILFAAHPRARVLAIDTAAAKAIPGVARIITAPDLPGPNRYGYNKVHHRPVLVAVGEETRFIGDALALVVAASEDIAHQAAQAITVSYEVLTPVSSPRQAAAPGAPRLHAAAEGNVCYTRELKHGDLGAGWCAAEVTIERSYHTPRQEQAFIETEGGIAQVDGAGVLHVQSCLQDPYVVAEDIHQGLAIPKSRIHIKGTPVGGGFGGKLDTTIQPHLAAMAWVTGLPVRLILDREDSFRFHSKRHPMEIRLKLGATRDGKITALEGEVWADAGPYSGRTFEVVGLTVTNMAGPYAIPHVRVSGQALYTNNLDSGAFRGFGAPQAVLARECALDTLARALDMDPLELRRRNFIAPGEKPVSPMLADSPHSLGQLGERILAEMGPKPTASGGPNKRIGRGICFDNPVFDVCAIPVLGKSGTGITVEVHSDGSVTVYAGGVELGQGITTVLTQMIAEEFRLPVDRVRVDLSDTWTSPRAGRTSASRLTYVLGNALLLATAKIRQTLLARAGELLQAGDAELALDDGHICLKGQPSRRVAFSEVAGACSDRGENLREQGWFRYPEDRYIYGHTYMVAATDVEVDMETGEVRLLKMANVLDAGKVINPLLAAGQLYGATVQALGYAVMEDMATVDGRLKTPSLAEYAIPTAVDLPEQFVVGSIETPYPTGPYGAKGIGEAALNCGTPAVLNAINDALGFELGTVPASAEAILLAVKGDNHG